MEPPQPPPTRKRKRPDTEYVFEEKVANLSLDDFPKPPGVNLFGGVDGQKVDIPHDAGPAAPFKEDQAPKKRAPVNEKERDELYKLDLSYFKILYNSKELDLLDDDGWYIHTYWCRRKFWEHYYRADPQNQYPEHPTTQFRKYQQEYIREQHANNRPPWWFRGFSSFEHKRAKYPKAWNHYENDIPVLASADPAYPIGNNLQEKCAREDTERWGQMATDVVEAILKGSKKFCKAEKERIGATTEVIEKYSQAIKDMKWRCQLWQIQHDFQAGVTIRLNDFLRQRRAEEQLASHKEGPERKKRRMK